VTDRGAFGLARSGELVRALTPAASAAQADLPGARHRAARGLVILFGGLSAALNVLLLSGSIFMLMVYDEVLPGHSLPSLVGLVALLLVAYAFQGGIEQLRQRLSAALGDLAEQRLAARVFGLVLRGDAARGGRDATQPVRDLDMLRGFLSGPAPLALLDLPWVILFMGVLFVFHWLLAVVCLIGAAVLVGLTLAADRLSAVGLETATRTGAERHMFLDHARRNSEVIRALGMTGAVLAGWDRLNSANRAANHATGDRLATMRTFSKTFRLLLQSLILATGAALVIGGEATGGVIIASSILSSRALAPIDSAIGNWRALIAARQAWNRLAERLDDSPAEISRIALPRPERTLSVESLSVVVPGTQTLLLRDVSFALSAGDALAVVGASGSGKTSLARALIGLLPAVRGAVRLDGAALDQWDADALGAVSGYLPQDIEMFDGTIGQNIARFTPDARDEEVIAAAQEAGVHDLIVRLPAGYETLIGPRGHALSAGQRQRVALARALFREPFLIVLDEPNSNLDTAGDLALARAVASARARGAIVVLIAHRPSALAEVDKLLWLDTGQVRAFGPKHEVMPGLMGLPSGGGNSGGANGGGANTGGSSFGGTLTRPGDAAADTHDRNDTGAPVAAMAGSNG